jgi:hypothetical protein
MLGSVRTTRYHNPENTLHSHGRENLKPKRFLEDTQSLEVELASDILEIGTEWNVTEVTAAGKADGWTGHAERATAIGSRVCL